jgi:hypothetical protein
MNSLLRHTVSNSGFSKCSRNGHYGIEPAKDSTLEPIVDSSLSGEEARAM